MIKMTPAMKVRIFFLRTQYPREQRSPARDMKNPARKKNQPELITASGKRDGCHDKMDVRIFRTNVGEDEINVSLNHFICLYYDEALRCL